MAARAHWFGDEEQAAEGQGAVEDEGATPPEVPAATATAGDGDRPA
jgi:hypothetical protein